MVRCEEWCEIFVKVRRGASEKWRSWSTSHSVSSGQCSVTAGNYGGFVTDVLMVWSLARISSPFYSHLILTRREVFFPFPPTHLLSATVRVYSSVAPCRLPDLTSLALLGSVSGQRGLSRGPLPGYKMVSKWRLQLQDSIPFLLLSQRLCTTLHTSASLGCYLLFTHMPDCPLAPLGQVWQQ